MHSNINDYSYSLAQHSLSIHTLRISFLAQLIDHLVATKNKLGATLPSKPVMKSL
jgi:hypothetical protein